MRSLSSSRTAEVAKRYVAGESPSEIAVDFGLSRESVVGLVRRLGIARTQAEAKRLADDRRRQRLERDGKRCGRCKTVKPLSEFYVRRSRRNGVTSRCKACVAELDAERAARPYNAQRSRELLLATYGLTEAEYSALLERQQGCCAICRSPANDKRLCVDHCHDTGVVRGLLCSPCNRAIGHLGDNAAGLRRALAYLEQF